MSARFSTGDKVRVRCAYPPGHVRTPYFIRGHTGVVQAVAGHYRNPEILAYGQYETPAIPLYRVQFNQTEVWPEYDGPDSDTMVVDIYENWLEPAEGDSA